DINGDVGVELVPVRQNGLQLDEVHLGPSHIHFAQFVYRDVQNVRFEIARGGGGGGQVHLDGLQLDHREAGHHEGGEQEKHDIDQRNDLDTGLFARQRRTNFHAAEGAGETRRISTRSFIIFLAVQRGFHSALPGGVDHHFHIGGRRLQLELQPRGFTGEKVEG